MNHSRMRTAQSGGCFRRTPRLYGARPLAFRLAAALSTFVFTTMGGATGVELHPLSQHGPHSSDVIAIELGAVAHPLVESRTPGHQALEGAGSPAHSSLAYSAAAAGVEGNGAQSATPGHHSGHPQHGSSHECTCIGACQGGTEPTVPDVASSDIPVGQTDRSGAVRVAVLPIHEDPTSYLFPFPNAPPGRS